MTRSPSVKLSLKGLSLSVVIETAVSFESHSFEVSTLAGKIIEKLCSQDSACVVDLPKASLSSYVVRCNGMSVGKTEPICAVVFLVRETKGAFVLHREMALDEFDYASNVHGFLKTEQGLALYDLAAGLGRGELAAEIGSYHGRSSVFIGAGLAISGGRLHSIDTFGNDAMSEGKRETLDFFTQNIGPYKSHIEPVMGTSSEAAPKVPSDLSLLFIDGDHSLAGCANDLQRYYPKVRDHGIIAFHEYFNKSERKRVKTVVDYFVDLGMLEILYKVRSMAVTRKRKNLIILTSPASKMGARSIKLYLVESGAIDSAAVISKTALRKQNDSKLLANAALSAGSWLALHNTLGLDGALRSKTVLYALQSVKRFLSKDGNKLKELKAQPFRKVLTNSRTLAVELRKLGLQAKHLYRPNDTLAYDDEYVPLPAEPAVLWYWKASHPPMEDFLETNREVMRRLTDVRILTFPDTEPPIHADHVTALGRIDLAEASKYVRGLVRISDPLDLGRSTFEVVARGRFFLSLGMDEEFGVCADSADGLIEKLRWLIDNFKDEQAKELHQYAKKFSRENLRLDFRTAFVE